MLNTFQRFCILNIFVIAVCVMTCCVSLINAKYKKLENRPNFVFLILEGIEL